MDKFAVAEKAFQERGFCFFRSEEMVKIRLRMDNTDRNLQFETIRALGDAEIAQFLDGNVEGPSNTPIPLTQRAFKQDVYQALEAERLLRSLKLEITRMVNTGTIQDVDSFVAVRNEGNEGTDRSLFVETLTGKVITLDDVTPSCTISELKRKIQDKDGTLIQEQQRLMVNGEQLEDGRTLQDYEITNGTTVYLLTTIEELKAKLIEWNNACVQSNKVLEELKKDKYKTAGKCEVLKAADEFLAEMDLAQQDATLQVANYGTQARAHSASGVQLAGPSDGSLLSPSGAPLVMGGEEAFAYVTGIVDSANISKLQRTLFTSLRGNAVTRYKQVDYGDHFKDPVTGDIKDLTCFIVYFHGHQSREKIMKFCNAYNATIIPNEEVTPPGGKQARDAMKMAAEAKMNELNVTIMSTNSQKERTLRKFYRTAQEMNTFVFEEKMIYLTLNKFKVSEGGTMLEAEAWVPAAAMEDNEGASYLHELLDKAKNKANSQAIPLCENVGFPVDTGIHGHHPKPPTLIRVNDFTSGFQGIVDGYGIPTYQEVNPGFFAIAMFPFLFGVMFGDIFHGFMMVAFALILIANQASVLKTYKQQNEIFLMLFDGRWTILMCGITAMYMGLIYNEGLSVAFDFFGSGYSMGHYPELTFGASSGVAVDCYSGSHWGEHSHEVWSNWGNDSCAVSSVAMSAAHFDNHTYKFLPTRGFKAGVADNGGGATFPSMFCDDYSQTISGKVKTYFNKNEGEGMSCTGGAADLSDSYNPMSMDACSDAITENCFNFSAISASVCNATLGTCTDFASMVTPNPYSASLQKFMPYVFGVDPVWRHSDQLISFTNSLKMKMSVILGVSQMTFGIILKILNFIHAGHWSLVFAVGVPEFLFMTCTFGYMNFLIFLKWSTEYGTSLQGSGPECFDNCKCPWTGYGSAPAGSLEQVPSPVSRAPPNIVSSMLSMFGIPSFMPGDPGDCFNWLYAEQKTVQTLFILIAVVAVPWLLLTEPCLIKCELDAERKRKEEEGTASLHANATEGEHGHDDEEEVGLADIFVHQAIHTIEFVLGCVSNTASYLRLWALSLAHSQLSEVFWEYIMMGYGMGFQGMYPGLAGGALMTIICFFIFWCCTMAVLMMMESLSAFLHALRLQWVEFQGKFYDALGTKFAPLTFDQMMVAAAEDN